MIAIDWNPDPPKLRQFAYFAPIGFGVVGLVVAWHLGAMSAAGSWTPSVWLWVIGLLTLAAGVIKPLLVKPLYLLLTVVTAPIGLVIGNLAMLLLYVLLFVPLGLIFKVIGRDTMQRSFRDGRESYWEKHTQPTDLKRYYRQF